MSEEHAARKPNRLVSAFNGRRWINCGVGWSDVTKDGKEYIKLRLDALPVSGFDGQLTIWPVGEERA